MKIRSLRHDRSAFTLVELMVAMALIIFIMYILAEAFAAGSTAFRNLKAVGDMNQRLRMASTVLRKYLSANHFDNGRKLSDPNFWANGPPTQGFFRIIQSGTAASPAGVTCESSDLDLIRSYSSTSQALHFAVNLRGNDPGDFFRTTVSGSSPLLSFPIPDSRYQEQISPATLPQPYNSQWAEVVVFMKLSGATTENPANLTTPLPLFTLFLRQRLIMPDGNTSPTNEIPSASYQEVSATQDTAGKLSFHNSENVTMPARRFGQLNFMPGSATDLANCISANNYPTLKDENSSQAGSDVLLQDVLSFSITVLLPDSAYPPAPNGKPAYFVPLNEPANPPNDPNGSIAQQYATTPANSSPSLNSPPSPNKNFVFDTWSQQVDAINPALDYSSWATPGSLASIPMYKHQTNGGLIQIRAIQISIRVWDARTQQTRQSNIVVPM